jgi:hypothetical protein
MVEVVRQVSRHLKVAQSSQFLFSEIQRTDDDLSGLLHSGLR